MIPEALPDLNGEGGHSSLLRTELQELRMLLDLARPEERSNEVTLIDLQRLITACKREGWGITSDATKRAKTAARVLGYIAAHHWALPPDAIDALKMEIKFANPKNTALRIVSTESGRY